jgi:hypothetical protein
LSEQARKRISNKCEKEINFPSKKLFTFFHIPTPFFYYTFFFFYFISTPVGINKRKDEIVEGKIDKRMRSIMAVCGEMI